jgi:hypothetical protein
MVKRLRLLHPPLFALFCLLSIPQHNPGAYVMSDLLSLVALVLGAVGALQLVLTVLLRGKAEEDIPAAITMLFVGWFFFYVPATEWLVTIARIGPLARTTLLPAAAALLTLSALWWLLWRKPHLGAFSRFMALAGSILLVWSAGAIVLSELRAPRAQARSELVKEFAQPIRVNRSSEASRSEPKRDIYLIILDEYANGSVLRERFGFANSVFEDSLRRLGFTIPPSVQSNYPTTLLSIPSLLNFGHVTQLEAELGPSSNDRSLPHWLVEDNRAVRFLKAHGYTFIFFRSFLPGLQSSPHADVEVDPWRAAGLKGELISTVLRSAFFESRTPFGVFVDLNKSKAEYTWRTFDELTQIPFRSEPTFALAHVYVTHWPYLFDAGCRTLSTPRKEGSYVDQVRCLNRKLLDLVRVLLKRSETPPIILLQADHGTQTLHPFARNVRFPSPAQARERFGAFGAYYLPAGGDSLFSDSVTVVNVLRNVFVHYFGADLAPRDNTLYFTPGEQEYELVRVDGAYLRAD